MGPIMISLGGSIIAKEEGVNMDFLKGFSEIILSSDPSRRFAIVTGGGYISKMYVNAAGAFTKSNYIKDEVGIAASRLNASMVSSMFNITKIAVNLEEIKRWLNTDRVVVAGGILPGITTDAVAALAAEACEAESIINISRSGGIYENGDGSTKRIAPRISHADLLRYALAKDERVARSNFIFDAIACRIAQRSSMTIHFVGEELEDIKNAVEGKAHSGTVVRSR